MLYAETEVGQKQFALPRLRGFCQICKQLLIPKCGKIKLWHWSHTKRIDCDPWFEPETRWHLDWKDPVVSSSVEVTFANHRADIVANNGTVIELQHSQISPSEIEERERFYGNLIWIVDATSFNHHLSFREKGTYYTFRWKWARQCWTFAKKPIFLDIGNGCLFEIRKIHPGQPRTFEVIRDNAGNIFDCYSKSRKVCAGWGAYIRKCDFIDKYFRGLLKSET